jgi:hypothetical protein
MSTPIPTLNLPPQAGLSISPIEQQQFQISQIPNQAIKPDLFNQPSKQAYAAFPQNYQRFNQNQGYESNSTHLEKNKNSLGSKFKKLFRS